MTAEFPFAVMICGDLCDEKQRKAGIAELLKKNQSLLPEPDEDDEGEEVDFDGEDEIDFFD